MKSKIDYRQLAEARFKKTVEMLEALLAVAQPEKGGGDNKEIESFRKVTNHCISKLTTNFNKFIDNPRKNNRFIKMHNEQMRVIEFAYQKVEKRKIEIRTGIAKRIINENVLKNHGYNKKVVIETMKNNFLQDDHVKQLIIYDNTIKDGNKSILVGVKKEPEKNHKPGRIKRWKGKIFPSKSKNEPVQEKPFELHSLTEEDDINKNSSKQIDDIDPVIEEWEIAMGNVRRPANELIQSCVVHVLYSKLKERNSIYTTTKKNLSNDAIKKVSQLDCDFNNKLDKKYRTCLNELKTVSSHIETYHKSNALTQKEYEESKKEIDSITTTLTETYVEMKKHGDLTADIKQSLATLPDVNEIDMNVDTTQSSPETIRKDLKRKLQQMKVSTDNLKRVRNNMLMQCQGKDTKRTSSLEVKFSEIDKKTKSISRTTHTSAQKKYEQLLEEKGKILFQHINKVKVLNSMKSEYDTSELEELRKQIKSDKVYLKKTEKAYEELVKKTDEDIANLSDVESSYAFNRSGNREMPHETLKTTIQRNKEMIKNRIRNISNHIDKLQEKEKALEKRKIAEEKRDKLNNELLMLEEKINNASSLLKNQLDAFNKTPKQEVDDDLTAMIERKKKIDDPFNNRTTLECLKKTEEKYSTLTDEWNKLANKVKKANDEIGNGNNTLLVKQQGKLTRLKHDIEFGWQTLAEDSVSKKFATAYEKRLSNKKEKTVYFDKKLGKKTYDFDKITEHAVTGSCIQSTTRYLFCYLFTSCTSRFFSNNDSSNDDGLSKQGNRTTQTIYHLLNGERKGRNRIAIRPKDNADSQKQIDKIRRKLLDQEIGELRNSMSNCQQ